MPLAWMIGVEFGFTMPRKPTQDFFLFLVGGALFAAGIFLFTNQVMVNSGFSVMGWGRRYGGGMAASFGGMFSWGTGQGFGLLMIPFGILVALGVAQLLPAHQVVGVSLVAGDAVEGEPCPPSASPVRWCNRSGSRLRPGSDGQRPAPGPGCDGRATP